jgi:hypothetical protein
MPVPVEQQEKNLLDAARSTLLELRGANYQARRRGVMYVATLLGHKMGPNQLREQSWGTVGQCANCDQVAKTAREVDVIEGRATCTICPAGRGDKTQR